MQNHSIGRTPAQDRRFNGSLIYLVILGLSFVAGLVMIGVNFWQSNISAMDWWLFGLGYWATIFGISIGIHRLLTHQSFRTYKFIKFIFLALGATAFQGFLGIWARRHREHHAKADVPCNKTLKPEKGECDWHTPHDGDLHAFAGWLLSTYVDETMGEHWLKAEERLEKVRQKGGPDQVFKEAELLDLIENRELAKFFDRTLAIWITLGMIIPMSVGAWSTGSWIGALTGLFWGGLFRMASVNVSTYLVNWYLHRRGWFGNYRHAEIKDDSNNNWLIGLFNPEAFHWGHHAFSWAANHGIYWYERLLDHSANIIWLMEKCGLAWDVRWATRYQLRKLKQALAGKVVIPT